MLQEAVVATEDLPELGSLVACSHKHEGLLESFVFLFLLQELLLKYLPPLAALAAGL